MSSDEDTIVRDLQRGVCTLSDLGICVSSFKGTTNDEREDKVDKAAEASTEQYVTVV